MKLPKLTLILPLFLAIGTYAQAEDAAPATPPPGGPPAKRGADFLKKFDKDGDGKLSDEEKAAAKEAMKDKKPEGGHGVPPEVLKKFDKDGDGKLSDEEKAAAKEAMKDKKPDGEKPEGGRGVPPEILKKFDKDGDGKLSDEERAAAAAEFKKNREEDMKKFDKDGDGKLDEAERLEAFKARLEANPEMKAKLLEKLDANKDGTLSDEELKKASAAMGGRGGDGKGDKEGEPRRIPKPKGKDAPKESN